MGRPASFSRIRRGGDTVGRVGGSVGRGVYPTIDAARIVDLDPRRIRRWVDGYAYSSPDGDARRQGPVFPREHSGETVALTFMDLVETLYVASFVRAG
jgi:hypothetical protein